MLTLSIQKQYANHWFCDTFKTLLGLFEQSKLPMSGSTYFVTRVRLYVRVDADRCLETCLETARNTLQSLLESCNLDLVVS